MTGVLLPGPRIVLRHPAVRTLLVLLAAGPVTVRWWGEAESAPVRLRLVGMLLAAAVALAWDDRAHVLTASTPVGLPAVRRGRLIVASALAAGCFGLAALALPDGQEAPVAAVTLQTVVLAAVLLAVAGWCGRDGDAVLVVPLPALLLTLAVLSRLPKEVAMLQADPRSPQWADERTRWWVLLALASVAVLRLQRDPATR
jgi:hypothetical protein